EARADTSEALAGKLRTLIQLIELISSSLDTDEILRQIAAAAVRVTDARCVSLWVADDVTRIVELRACSNAAIGAGHPRPRLAYGQGVAGWVTLHREPVKADDLRTTPMLARSGTRISWARWKAAGARPRCSPTWAGSSRSPSSPTRSVSASSRASAASSVRPWPPCTGSASTPATSCCWRAPAAAADGAARCPAGPRGA